MFMLTDNAHMIALDRSNGELLWETEMADWHQNYNGTSAPLTVGNLVISGTAGGDEGVRGFVAAFDQSTGKEVWRFWTVPLPGEPGSETWKGKDVEHRSGRNLDDRHLRCRARYACTGRSAIPGPISTATSARATISTPIRSWRWKPRPASSNGITSSLRTTFTIGTRRSRPCWSTPTGKVSLASCLLQANRNGFFYVLDRTNGKLLLGKPFLRKLNWAEATIGKDGRPIMKNLPKDANGDTYVCPGFQGGANWYSTSFNPATGFYYFSALERCNNFSPRHGEWQAGRGYMGGAARPAARREFRKIPARDQHSDRRDRLRRPAGHHAPDSFGGRDVHGLRAGVLRRKQRIVHGGRRR